MTIEQLKNEIAYLEQQQNQYPDSNFTQEIISLKDKLKKMEEIDAREKQNSKVRRNR